MVRRCFAVAPIFPMSASGSLPSGHVFVFHIGHDFADGRSVRPSLKPIFTLFPLISSIATVPQKIHMSETLALGYFCSSGATTSRALSRPAFAPHAASGVNRIVAPSEPPFFSEVHHVPEECHASRTRIGPTGSSMYLSSSRSATTSRRTLSQFVLPMLPATSHSTSFLLPRPLCCSNNAAAAALESNNSLLEISVSWSGRANPPPPAVAVAAVESVRAWLASTKVFAGWCVFSMWGYGRHLWLTLARRRIFDAPDILSGHASATKTSCSGKGSR
mmetsp:Transcript_2172/g.5081  ORF Transcript_2172/g.5081 Transcript_2172/m.5081 type:complete len:275 (-) Transcript_2172:248-1072(-)